MTDLPNGNDSGAPTDNDPIVPNPTYMGYIRNCFTADDVAHMASKGYDLGTYQGVKHNAAKIYMITLMPNAPMPPSDPPPAPQRDKWSANRSLNFKNWIMAGCPQGTATVQAGPAPMAASTAGGRVRKNVNSLSAQEIETLTNAFNGIMALDPSNPNSYMALAGIHGYPGNYCLHHVDPYNPWHRYYINTFEDALRSIPGCEDVTLPYWDITEPSVPALFSQAPFDKYTIETSINDPQYTIPYTTSRFRNDQIEANLADYEVTQNVELGLRQSIWGAYGVNGFQDAIIAAHDGGHAATGHTMIDQGVASFDPIFWFFHCNWERVFWSWQNLVGATTLDTFTTTLPSGDTGWLTFPPLAPWSATAADTIPDSGADYDKLATEATPMLENKMGSIEASRAFTVDASTPASVMVKGIDRLSIPGTFIVHLLADGEPIRKRAFFQPTNPRKCANCREHGLVNVNFRVPVEELQGRTLSVAIEVPTHEEEGKAFPLSKAGNPTVNARLLLDEA
ncbi:MAG: tyrosinase [Sphingomonadales bacterium]|jgi:hypothetical protein|nr:tyrosinase [Sphingomonadales bacterium]